MTANDQTPEKQTPLDFDSTGDESESFEMLFDELETIANRLEDGALNFEQSIALYEQGVKLASRCQQFLGEVEQRIEILRGRTNDERDPE